MYRMMSVKAGPKLMVCSAHNAIVAFAEQPDSHSRATDHANHTGRGEWRSRGRGKAAKYTRAWPPIPYPLEYCQCRLPRVAATRTVGFPSRQRCLCDRASGRDNTRWLAETRSNGVAIHQVCASSRIFAQESQIEHRPLAESAAARSCTRDRTTRRIAPDSDRGSRVRNGMERAW